MAGTTLRFEDVSVGDAAPERRHELTRADFVRYAGASGDFNPMHTDETAAQASGLPSVFGHGMLTAGLLGTAITDWIGLGALRTFSIRFTKQTWPGEVLTTSVTVTGTRDEDGERLVDLECAVTNADGEVKVSGTAVAAAPRAG